MASKKCLKSTLMPEMLKQHVFFPPWAINYFVLYVIRCFWVEFPTIEWNLFLHFIWFCFMLNSAKILSLNLYGHIFHYANTKRKQYGRIIIIIVEILSCFLWVTFFYVCVILDSIICILFSPHSLFFTVLTLLLSLLFFFSFTDFVLFVFEF